MIAFRVFVNVSYGDVTTVSNYYFRRSDTTINTFELVVAQPYIWCLTLQRLFVLYIDLRPGQTCHSKDGGSCIFDWRRQAWLTIWDRVKIPRYSHKLMNRERVICELHDSYFRSIMIKTCHSKDGGSCIFRWQFMGRD